MAWPDDAQAGPVSTASDRGLRPHPASTWDPHERADGQADKFLLPAARPRALGRGARLTHRCSASLRRVIAAFSSAPAGPATAEGHGGLDKTGADSGDPRGRGSRYSGRAPRGAV